MDLIRVYYTSMRKHITISLDEEVYAGLHRVIGKRKIASFIESVVRPLVVKNDLNAAYREMAADEVHEAEAQAWIRATGPGKVARESR